MKSASLIRRFVTLCLFLQPAVAHAAEMQCVTFSETNSGKCKAMTIVGAVKAGDSQKFREFLRQNLPDLAIVALNSPGGQVDQALSIGRFIRRYDIETQAPTYFPPSIKVPQPQGALVRPAVRPDGGSLPMVCTGPKCYCASACFLIWAGGVHREGDMLGLHRPSPTDVGFSTLSAAEASTRYRAAIKNVASYLEEMEISPKEIDEMIDTPSDDIVWLGAGEMQPDDLSPASIAEWIKSTCGFFNQTEGIVLNQTIKLVAHNPADAAAKHRLYDLYARRDAVDDCRQAKFAQQRSLMASP